MGALCVYEIPLLINMSNGGVEHPWSVEQGAEARGSPVSHRIPRKLHLLRWTLRRRTLVMYPILGYVGYLGYIGPPTTQSV